MGKDRIIATPSHTKEIMDRYQLSMKKSLGQNFLVEPSILENIVQAAELDGTQQVIEIGPGIGALTEFLAQNSKEVIAFEIDQRLLPILEDTLQDYDNVTVLHQDALKADLLASVDTVFETDTPVTVVANLPYYITTPIMLHLLKSALPIETMAVMMQKEVAERITAVPGTKAYGSLSIAVQYYMQAHMAFIVPKTVFIPQPSVDSAVLQLKRRDTPIVQVIDETFFFEVVRASFEKRRKTLWNNLIGHFGKDDITKEWLEESLTSVAIDPKRRGETLSIEEFAQLANMLIKNRSDNGVTK